MRKSVATSVTQFVLAGLAAVVLISAGTIYVVRRNATTEAIRAARDIASIDGHAVAEPVLDDGVLSGAAERAFAEPVLDEGVSPGGAGSLKRVDTTVRGRILSDRVVRVKIWTPEG